MGNINEHDMTKTMLDILRNNNQQANSLNENKIINNEPNKRKEIIDEHDMTKVMLGIIRENKQPLDEFRNTPTLDVSTEPSTEPSTDTSNDVIKVENDELSEESTKLVDIVGGVDLKLYEIYPKENNVVMVGVLDNGIEFKFSKKEQAPYINTENMRLDIEAVETIKKLQAYFTNWLTYWAEKIKEYKHSV